MKLYKLIVLICILLVATFLIWPQFNNKMKEHAQTSNIVTSQRSITSKQAAVNPAVPSTKEADSFEEPVPGSTKNMSDEEAYQWLVNRANRTEKRYTDLIQLHPALIWDEWLKRLDKKTFEAPFAETAALAEALRKTPDLEIYSQIEKYLTGATTTEPEKVALLALLAKIATPEALTIVLRNAELKGIHRDQIPGTIVDMGENFPDSDKIKVELAKIMDKAWSFGNYNDVTRAALVNAMGIIGEPSSVKLLLSVVAESDITNLNVPTDPDLSNIGISILQTLGRVTNAKSIPIIKQVFLKPLNQSQFQAAGHALSYLGRFEPKATQILLDWAQKAHDKDEPLVKRWFENYGANPGVSELIVKTLDPQNFHSKLIYRELEKLRPRLQLKAKHH